MAIVLCDISKQFGEHLVVNHVSLEIGAGELFVLLGSSGSGKSTILRLIAGLLSPDHGRIEIHGRDVTQLPPQRRDTGFVFQNYALFRHMSVAENVEFGLKIRRSPRSERRRRCGELLELVGLGGLGSRLPSQLSGGQRQRVALARALAYQPEVLLLDEPFGALDQKIRCQLRRSLKEIQRRIGVTAILVTHDQEEAFEVGDRIGILDRGRLVETGSPEGLYSRPQSEFVAAFLGGGNVIVGRADNDHHVIRLGAAELPFPAGSPPHEDGAPVRLLFRPETVRHSPAPFAPGDGVIAIGQGRLAESTFAGAIKRLRFEIETLQGARPLMPVLAYGQRYAAIEAVQAADPAGSETAAAIGEQRWIGLSSYHVLRPSALKFLAFLPDLESSKDSLEVCRLLSIASHGSTTLLAVVPPGSRAEEVQQRLAGLRREAAPAGEPRIEIKVRCGPQGGEVIREIEEGYYDMMAVSRAAIGDGSPTGRLAQIIRRALVSSGLPVLIAAHGASAIRRMLICTAAGEPGKTDVRFGARLARHIRSFTTVFHAAREGLLPEELERVRKHLGQAGEMLNAFKLENEIKIGGGPVLDAIIGEANCGHDLVVVGASGSESYRGAYDLVGRLLDKTGCSVLIVPMAENS